MQISKIEPVFTVQQVGRTGSYFLRGTIIEDIRFEPGDVVFTTVLKSIDFERGIAITKTGTIYLWEVK